MNVGSALAEAVAPLLAGYVIQKTGDWNLPFVGSIGLLLFGAIFAYWMKRKKSEKIGNTAASAVRFVSV